MLVRGLPGKECSPEKCHSHSYVYVTPASRFILGCLLLIRNASVYFRNASWGIRRRMTGFAQSIACPVSRTCLATPLSAFLLWTSLWCSSIRFFNRLPVSPTYSAPQVAQFRAYTTPYWSLMDGGGGFFFVSRFFRVVDRR